MTFTGNKKDVVQFVSVLLMYLRNDLQSITIIIRGMSEVSSVSIAISTSLEGRVKRLAQTYSLQLTDT